MDWRLLMDVRCTLGEGVFWHPPSGRVMWVDIHECMVHAWDLSTQALTTWVTPQRVGWLIPRQHAAGFVAGFQGGFASLNLEDDGEMAWSWLNHCFDGRPAMRLNDAKADSVGRIWAGSLNNDDESRPEGALYCLTADGIVRTVDTGYCVANGPAIHPEGKLFLHTDSARKTIYAFDLDESAGVLSNKRTWQVMRDDEGYPDGMNFDAQGCVWVAHWGAGLVSRYSSEGVLLARIKLPVSNVTNVAFGGERFDRLFVTTARAGLSAQQLALEPHAGGLFEVLGHGASGLASLPFAG